MYLRQSRSPCVGQGPVFYRFKKSGKNEWKKGMFCYSFVCFLAWGCFVLSNVDFLEKVLWSSKWQMRLLVLGWVLTLKTACDVTNALFFYSRVLFFYCCGRAVHPALSKDKLWSKGKFLHRLFDLLASARNCLVLGVAVFPRPFPCPAGQKSDFCRVTLLIVLVWQFCGRLEFPAAYFNGANLPRSNGSFYWRRILPPDGFSPLTGLAVRRV